MPSSLQDVTQPSAVVRLPTNAAIAVAPGTGVLMTTYDGSTSEVRTTAAPVDVAAPAATLEALLDQVWEALDPALRVAALAVDADSPDAPPLLRA